MIKRLFGLAIAIGALVLWLAAPIAHAQLPTGPTAAVKTTFPVDNPPAEFQVVQSVVDFAPGAWTTPHTHGALVFVTVVKGEMSYHMEEADKTYKAGETWTEKPGDLMQIGNTASAPARTLVTFLLPPGAELTTNEEVAGAKASAVQPTKMTTTFPATHQPGPFDLIEVEQDFAPGAITPVHTHGGPAFITVISGQLTLVSKGIEKVYSAGQSWMETPGDFMQVANKGTAPASTFVTFLLPKGAQLTTNQQPDAAVNNSSPAPVPQQAAPLTNTPATPAWLFPFLGLVALVIVGGGALLVRRRFSQR